MAKGNRSPNDQRADAHNPTSREYKSNADHQSNIHNPTSSDYKASNDNRSKQMNR